MNDTRAIAQDFLEYKINRAIKDIEAACPQIAENIKHYHLCTFCLLNIKAERANEQCNQYIATHNIQPTRTGETRYDYCDNCPMMNYVALDDYGRIMYVLNNEVIK